MIDLTESRSLNCTIWSDPGETTNLVEQQPKIVARLKQAYDEWFDDVSSTRPAIMIRLASPWAPLTRIPPC